MRFTFLGTSGAVPSAERDNTSLVFAAAGAAVLVDCGGSPIQKLRRAGVDPLALTHVVVTHLHADHAYGLPSLVQGLRLLGRVDPLVVVTRPEHVEPLGTLLEIFRVRARPGMFRLDLVPVSLEPGATAFETGALRVRTAPNHHGEMPNFAARIERRDRRAAVVYSSDTTPCDAVVALARDAHTLVHEATMPARDRGRHPTHTAVEDAGEIAARAGVERLILAHVGHEYHGEVEALADEARQRFGGEVAVARDLAAYEV